MGTKHKYQSVPHRLNTVTGDRYAGEWPRERFRVHGIIYELSPQPKSGIYRDFLPLVNSGEVALLDNEALKVQLLNLERRTSRSGDTIDHPPRGTDDVANAAAGVLTNWNSGFFEGCDLS